MCVIFKLRFQPSYFSIIKTNVWKKKTPTVLLFWIKYNHYRNFFETELTLKWIITYTQNFSKRQNCKNKSFILNSVCLKNNYYDVFSGQVFLCKWVEFICVNKIYIRHSIYILVGFSISSLRCSPTFQVIQNRMFTLSVLKHILRWLHCCHHLKSLFFFLH